MPFSKNSGFVQIGPLKQGHSKKKKKKPQVLKQTISGHRVNYSCSGINDARFSSDSWKIFYSVGCFLIFFFCNQFKGRGMRGKEEKHRKCKGSWNLKCTEKTSNFPKSKQKVVAGSSIKWTTCSKRGPEEKQPAGTKRNRTFLKASVSGSLNLRCRYISGLAVLAMGAGKTPKHVHPGCMLAVQFLADTSTHTQRVRGVLGRSTCAEAREAGGTSPAKLLTHAGSLSESPGQSPGQSKYSQDERETGPTVGSLHPGANTIYACWFMIWILVLCSHLGGGYYPCSTREAAEPPRVYIAFQ